MAREISRSRLRVCLLESGGRKPAEDTQNLNAGAVDSAYGYREQTLRDGRCRQFGGTSKLWNRQVRGDSGRHIRYVPLDEIDFERRDWVPESGWPFSFDDRCSVIEGDFFGSLPSGADTQRRRYLPFSPYHSRLERRAISPDPE
jgi:choline dehydrogenase-like flavoprotein